MLLAAMPAVAQSPPATTAEGATLRPLCGSRPGLGTPPCILDKGHVQVEIGLVTSQTDTEDNLRSGTIAYGSTEATYGIDGLNQVSLIWAPFNKISITDTVTGRRREYSGVGDVALRWRHSLRNPDGEGLSIAIEGLVNVPTGPKVVSQNEWGFGLLVPLSVAITDTLAFIAAPGFVWSENTNSNGQHFDYNGSFGLSKTWGSVTCNVEAGYARDGEPGSGRSSATLATSLAWSPPDSVNFQMDVGVSIGTNPDAPDLQGYVGLVQRF
jgi:hypothetical protein